MITKMFARGNMRKMTRESGSRKTGGIRSRRGRGMIKEREG